MQKKEIGKLCQRSHSKGRWWTLAGQSCIIVSAFYQDELPETTSAKLPPEYIVSRKVDGSVRQSDRDNKKED